MAYRRPSVSVVVVALLIGFPLLAAGQSVGLTKPSVVSVTAGVATVTVTSAIPDLSVLPTTVILQRINSNGTVTTMGKLHDDGLNGDAAWVTEYSRCCSP